MKFYIRYLLCNQRDSEGSKLRDQAVGAYCHEVREPLELMECKLVPGKQVLCARSTWKNSEGEEIATVSFRQHRRR
jgi:hypothetical protein